MKKFFSIILCLCLVCVVISGCVNNRDKREDEDLTHIVTDPNLEVELRFRYFGDETYFNLMDQLIARFEEENPKTVIIKEEFTGNYYTTLLTDFASGIEPDLFFMQPSEIASFVKEGYLAALNHFIDKGGDIKKDDLFEVTYQSFSFNGNEYGKGNLYGIVKDWSPDFMLIYNKTLIDYARENIDPTLPELSYDKQITWQEFERIAKAVNRIDSKYQATALNPPYHGTMLDSNTYELMVQFILQNGGKLYSDDFNKINLLQPEVKGAIEFFTGLQNGPDSAAPFQSSLQQNLALTEFARGKNAMMFCGKWYFPAYITTAKNFEIGVTMPPVPEGKEPLVMTSGLLGYSMSANTLYPDRAYKLIEFLMTEGVKLFAEHGYNIPGIKSAAQNMFENEQDENIRKYDLAFNYALDHVAIMPTNPYLSNTSFIGLMRNKIEAFYSGSLSLDSALQSAKNEIEGMITYNRY